MRSNILRGLACVLLIVGGAAAALVVGHRAIVAHLNSDLLYPFELYNDFFVDRGRDWTHLSATPATFFAPDLIVFGLLRRALRDPGWTLHAYAVFAWLSLVGASYAVVRAASSWRASLEVSLVGGVLWLVGLLDADRTELVTLLPIYHHGSLVNGLLCVALLLRAARDGWTRPRQACFVVLLLLASLSDLVFVTQFLLPALAALVVAARGGAVPWSVPRRATVWMVVAGVGHLLVLRAVSAFTGIHFRGNPIALHIDGLTSWPLCAALAATVILAWTGRSVIARHGVIFGLALGLSSGALAQRLASTVAPSGWPLAQAHRFAAGLYQLAATDPQIWILLPAAVAVALLSHQQRAPVAARILAVMFVVQTALLLVEGSLTFVGHGRQVLQHPDVFDEGTLRHLQPLYVLPPMVMGALWLWRRQAAPPGWLTVGTLVLLAVRLCHSAPTLPTVQLPYPDEVRCLDEAGLGVGYGDYWTARYITLLSHRSVEVDPVELHYLGVERWENNPAHYLAHATPYQFIVVGRWRRERLIARFGEPARTVACGELEALVYDRPEDFAFRNLLHVGALADTERALPPAPRGLGHPIADGASDARAPLAQAVLAAPAAGGLVEISLPGAARTTLSLYGVDGVQIERLAVPAVEGPGTRRRWLARTSRVPVARVGFSPPVAVAHLFFYDDKIVRN